jgi:alanine-glyoxylate transaminase/serine-glyoxylate transaminase/serine-pyruvate transaminase
VASEWNKGADYEGLKAALEADTGHVIKAVGCVHNETSTGMVMDLPRVRAILDAAKHPALLLADTISSLGSLDFRMDEWGIDCAVGGSQKGLMMPTGLSFRTRG